MLGKKQKAEASHKTTVITLRFEFPCPWHECYPIQNTIPGGWEGPQCRV